MYFKTILLYLMDHHYENCFNTFAWSFQHLYHLGVGIFCLFPWNFLLLCLLGNLGLYSKHCVMRFYMLLKSSGKCWYLYFSRPYWEKAMATHSSALAWKIPRTGEPGRLQSMGSLRVGHDWATSLSLFTFMHWGNDSPLQCSCLENPRDGGA